MCREARNMEIPKLALAFYTLLFIVIKMRYYPSIVVSYEILSNIIYTTWLTKYLHIEISFVIHKVLDFFFLAYEVLLVGYNILVETSRMLEVMRLISS